jgi:hypothetical protein
MKNKWYQKTWVKVVGVLLLIGFIGNIFMPKKINETTPQTTIETSQYYVNLFNIANKNLDSVEVELGKGKLIDQVKDTKSGCSECPKYSFRNGDIEIVFINDRADWITVRNMDASFKNCTIDILGPFDCINRNVKTDHVLRWYNVKGFKEVALFRKYEDKKATSRVDYAYIKTSTE